MCVAVDFLRGLIPAKGKLVSFYIGQTCAAWGGAEQPMANVKEARRRACIDKTNAEVEALEAKGVVFGGNAFSSILFAKGELTPAEKTGAEPYFSAEGQALQASIKALGYAPEEWETLLTCDAAGEPLDALVLREAVATLDPATLVCCDEAAAAAVREAFADDLAILDSFEEAMLEPGFVAHVCGMRVLNLGGFAAALGDSRQKQLMWARLKQIPPLAEPY